MAVTRTAATRTAATRTSARRESPGKAPQRLAERGVGDEGRELAAAGERVGAVHLEPRVLVGVGHAAAQLVGARAARGSSGCSGGRGGGGRRKQRQQRLALLEQLGSQRLRVFVGGGGRRASGLRTRRKVVGAAERARANASAPVRPFRDGGGERAAERLRQRQVDMRTGGRRRLHACDGRSRRRGGREEAAGGLVQHIMVRLTLAHHIARAAPTCGGQRRERNAFKVRPFARARTRYCLACGADGGIITDSDGLDRCGGVRAPSRRTVAVAARWRWRCLGGARFVSGSATARCSTSSAGHLRRPAWREVRRGADGAHFVAAPAAGCTTSTAALVHIRCR